MTFHSECPALHPCVRQVKEVDPTLDLAAADYDALNPGFGIARDGRKEDPNVRTPHHPTHPLSRG